MRTKELIKEYLINIYKFSSGIDGWAVLHKDNNKRYVLNRVITDLERIFPNMGVSEVVNEWWEFNVKSIEDRIEWFMDNYKLKLGNNMIQAWDIVDSGGRKFYFDDLMGYLKTHHNEQAVMIIFDKWFDVKLLEANMELMGVKD